MIRLHHRTKLGDGSDYYDYEFMQLKRGDYYWVERIGNEFRVVFKIGNYVLGKKELGVMEYE